MHIVIAGGTGYIGQHLVAYYTNKQHHITLISRTTSGQFSTNVSSLTWDQIRAEPQRLEGTDVIINLAGSSINQRWTESGKKLILQSRLDSAARIAELVEALETKPQVVINASGMSIYGTSETDTYDETSPARITDFLAGVVEQWEAAADQIIGTRLVKLRIGLVLSKDGGAFPKMLMPYRLGVGGPIGSGKQVLSWIHIEDMIRLIDFCIKHEEIDGAVNAVGPEPVTNDVLGRTIANIIHRPYLFPLPAFVMKLLFGELSILLLEGQRVLPRVLQEHGFAFKYPTVELALRNILRN